MSNNAERIAILAAGYLLGRSKKMKLALMVAGGVAYKRFSAGQDGDDAGGNSSIAQRFSGSPELQRVTSGLAEAARGAVTATALKGVDTLNENLQNRTAAIHEENQPAGQAEEPESGSEGSEEEPAEAIESGGR